MSALKAEKILTLLSPTTLNSYSDIFILVLSQVELRPKYEGDEE